MSEPDVPTVEQMVVGLLSKRMELLGVVEERQRYLKNAVVDLERIEATLWLFKPDLDIAQMGTRPAPPPYSAFKGEVTRIVFDTLRAATRPLTTNEITEAMMKARGLPVEDRKLFQTMAQRVGSMCNHWRRVKGVLKSSPGPGKMLCWEIDTRKTGAP